MMIIFDDSSLLTLVGRLRPGSQRRCPPPPPPPKTRAMARAASIHSLYSHTAVCVGDAGYDTTTGSSLSHGRTNPFKFLPGAASRALNS